MTKYDDDDETKTIDFVRNKTHKSSYFKQTTLQQKKKHTQTKINK